MTVQARSYSGEDDYRRIGDLLVESYNLTRNHLNWWLDRLDTWRFFRYATGEVTGQRDWMPLVHLWETGDGQLVGAVHPEDDGWAFFEIHPAYRHLEPDMLAWAEEHLAAPTEDGHRRLRLSAYDHDAQRQDMLRAQGYTQLDEFGYDRYMDLNQPIPAGPAAAGYTVRTISESVADAVLAAQAWSRGFASTRMHPARYRVRQLAPTYDPTLDFIAIAPDGSGAAITTLWYDARCQIGQFEPVATAPEHRRLGLAKALMCEGLRQLKARGATRAYVGCDGANGPGNRLYESVGFTQFYREYTWHKIF